jgi:subtilase family serine protease
LVAVTLAAPSAGAAPSLLRLGHAPLLPSGAKTLGALADATPLHVTVALAPRDPGALKTFATAVSTPGSPIYGQYLSSAQFAQRFGATGAQIAAVTASLRSHGLSPGRVSANGLSIPFTATAAAVEQAFSLKLVRIALATGATAITNTVAPLLDGAIAGVVQGVVGLSSVAAPRPLALRRARTTGAVRPSAIHHVATGGPQPCAAASAAAASQKSYTSDQIASAYGLSGLYAAGDQGAGQTVALYELEPNDPADIAAFQSCYGTNASISYAPVDGGAGSGAGSGEAALDIENAIGIAPKATFIVYQAPNSNSGAPGAGPYDMFSAIISQNRANVVSVSWGECEALIGSANASAESTLFQEAAAQGQTVVSAAGDQGAQDCNASGGLPNLSTAVDDPASQPFVTGIGGTTMSAIGPRPTEQVWNNGSLLGLNPMSGAGGGGTSSLWSMPSYQAKASAALNVVQSGAREVPDLSANADPSTGYLIYWNGSSSASGSTSGWQTIGGTSAASPVISAMFALANASPGCRGTPLGFANPALYNAAGSGYAANFNDITAGNNDFTGTNLGQYAARAGYDMASGLGTPNGAALAAAMCASGLRVGNPGTQTSIVRRPTSLQLRASDGPGAAITYAASGLPPGLTISATTGRISGTPTRAGSWVVNAVVRDSLGSVSGTAFAWSVQGSPTVSRVSLRGVGPRRPTLRFTVTAGAAAPALAAVVIGPPRGLAFARHRGAISVTGTGGKRIRSTIAYSRGALVITLKVPASRFTVAIGYPAITAGAQAAASARAHRLGKLMPLLYAVDAHSRAARIKVAVKPSS